MTVQVKWAEGLKETNEVAITAIDEPKGENWNKMPTEEMKRKG